MKPFSILAAVALQAAAVVTASEAHAMTSTFAQSCITAKAKTNTTIGVQKGTIVAVGPASAPTGYYADFTANFASVYVISGATCANTYIVHNSDNARYKANNGPTGPEGWPLSDEFEAPGNNGRANNFQNGTIWWHAGQVDQNAWALWGQINSKYNMLGDVVSVLGFPVSDPHPYSSTGFNGTAVVSGQSNNFENGYLIWAQNQGNSWSRNTWAILNKATEFDTSGTGMAYLDDTAHSQEGKTVTVTGYFTPGSNVTLQNALPWGRFDFPSMSKPPTQLTDANGAVTWVVNVPLGAAAFCPSGNFCIATFDLSDYDTNQFAVASINVGVP
jgi:uncharacterized protein with LGFP repeats